MPIYEYRCGNCGYEMEAIQKISEAPLVDCPRCETAQLRKKISRVAFRLKGSGWYETDFKSGQQRNLAGADNDSGKDQPSGDGGEAAASASGGAGSDAGKDAKNNGKTAEKAASNGSGKASGGGAKAASAAASAAASD
ncbi:MAG: zinc ribbon domain-containing protein [Gammaproteobacteria bacterium]|nr:zinc ribbon domain-containing protein [Gammaproteobacteria bacterium]